MRTILPKPDPDDRHDSFMAAAIGRSRIIVVVAVIAVMVAAFSLFLMGAVLTLKNIGIGWINIAQGEVEVADLTVQFLEIVTVMLKAVVFYLIGVGLYSLFIAPLNLTLALGIETLNDLEAKIISVVVVIMGVTFLDRFIRWEDPLGTMQYAIGLAVSVVALVFFQIHTRREGKERRSSARAQAKRELFQKKHEQQIIPGENGQKDTETP